MSRRPQKPVLGLTMGDPAGIGPEVLVRALAEAEVRSLCRPLVLGDVGILQKAAETCRLGFHFKLFSAEESFEFDDDRVGVIPVSELDLESFSFGRPDAAGGRAAAEYISLGARLALEGRTQGLVTGPISKEALNKAGRPFPGHTEFLADMAGGPDVVMMLAGDRLKVVLVTIHEALADVPGLLSVERILTTAGITDRALRRDFSLDRPRLAVAALNPHAGESGLFGREEETIIAPAVERGQEEGLNLSGPHPPDTLFYRAVNGEFDAVVCMYHDQGLIPFKLIHFKDGVNVTLGLPFIRTSVDHGTAYDLAGRGQADHFSLVAALKMAAEMAQNR